MVGRGRLGATLVVLALCLIAAQPSAAHGNPPVVLSDPWIAGDWLYGGTSMTAGDARFDEGGARTSYASRWERCDSAGQDCHDIAGATTGIYDPTPFDIGGTLRFAVTATNAFGSATAFSAVTGVIEEALAPAFAGDRLTILGEAQVGALVNPDQSAWGVRAGTVTLSYRWLRCDGSGAGARRFALKPVRRTRCRRATSARHCESR